MNGLRSQKCNGCGRTGWCFRGVLGTLSVLSLMIAQGQSLNAQPNDARSVRPPAHRGEFLGAANGELIMTIEGQGRQTRTLSPEARITLNGKPAKIADLQKGDNIRVTTQRGERSAAVAVDATRSIETGDERRRSSDEPADPQTKRDQRENWLGVWIEPTPDNVAGVRVAMVHVAGPAARAGLRSGDYILRVNDTKVSDPQQLTELIGEIESGSQAEIVAWRDGRQQRLQVDFDVQDGRGASAEHRAFFRGDQQGQAWLGVTLDEESEAAGARIRAVFPSGPAARAGLRQGDVVTRLNDKQVDDAEMLVEVISEMKPGSDAELTIQRTDQQLTLTARLGDRAAYLGQPFSANDGNNQSFGPSDEFSSVPDHAMMLEQHRHFSLQHQRLEEQLQQVLEELKALRGDVEELKRASN